MGSPFSCGSPSSEACRPPPHFGSPAVSPPGVTRGFAPPPHGGFALVGRGPGSLLRWSSRMPEQSSCERMDLGQYSLIWSRLAEVSGPVASPAPESFAPIWLLTTDDLAVRGRFHS